MNCDECRYWKWGGYTHREHGDLGVCSLKLPPNGPPSKLGAPTRVTYRFQGCDLGQPPVQGDDR